MEATQKSEAQVVTVTRGDGKEVTIPAKVLVIGNETKLVPLSTSKLVLYGLPMPKGLEVSEEVLNLADRIIQDAKDNNDPDGDRSKTILVRYVRGGEDGFALGCRILEDGSKEYDVFKAPPLGALVAFKFEDRVYIGWSKHAGPDNEPLEFNKKHAIRVAVLRALLDEVVFLEGWEKAITAEHEPIPDKIAIQLESFFNRASRYFKVDYDSFGNVFEEVDELGVEEE
jgi:hypothetical protein